MYIVTTKNIGIITPGWLNAVIKKSKPEIIAYLRSLLFIDKYEKYMTNGTKIRAKFSGNGKTILVNKLLDKTKKPAETPVIMP